MNNFTYARVADVGSAVGEIASRNTRGRDGAGQQVTGHEAAKFIAGGTNLIDLMKYNVERPAHLVDITRTNLDRIEELPDGGLRLGALVSNTNVAYDERVRERYPLLSETILAGASPQLRNMASTGGNLLQRTRCTYFYDTATRCNKREPGTGCPARDGYNRQLAILGTSESCIATHPSDMCVALSALEAVVQTEGANGARRSIPIADFHRLPGDTPHIDTTLRADEIITAVDLPAKGFPDHHLYLKLRDRASYAFALVSVAVALEMDGDVIEEARIAIGGVAHKPWRVQEAEETLRGKLATRDDFEQAADLILRGARGFGHNTFKIELAKRAIPRALKQAVEMKGK